MIAETDFGKNVHEQIFKEAAEAAVTMALNAIPFVGGLLGGIFGMFFGTTH